MFSSHKSIVSTAELHTLDFLYVDSESGTCVVFTWLAMSSCRSLERCEPALPSVELSASEPMTTPGCATPRS